MDSSSSTRSTRGPCLSINHVFRRCMATVRSSKDTSAHLFPQTYRQTRRSPIPRIWYISSLERGRVMLQALMDPEDLVCVRHHEAGSSRTTSFVDFASPSVQRSPPSSHAIIALYFSIPKGIMLSVDCPGQTAQALQIPPERLTVCFAIAQCFIDAKRNGSRRTKRA